MLRDILSVGKIKNYLDLTYTFAIKFPGYFLCSLWEPLLNTQTIKQDGQISYDIPTGTNSKSNVRYRLYKNIHAYQGSGSSRVLNISTNGIYTDTEFSFLIYDYSQLEVKPGWFVTFEVYDESRVFQVENIEYSSILQTKKIVRLTCKPTSFVIDDILPAVIDTYAQLGKLIVPEIVYFNFANYYTTYKKLIDYLKIHAILTKQLIEVNPNTFSSDLNYVVNQFLQEFQFFVKELEIYDCDSFYLFRQYNESYSIDDLLNDKPIQILNSKLEKIDEIPPSQTEFGKLLLDLYDKKNKFVKSFEKEGI